MTRFGTAHTLRNMKITIEAEAVSEGDTSMTVRLITGFGDPIVVISKDCLYGEK